MKTQPETADDSLRSVEHAGNPTPGVIVLHSGERAQWRVIPFREHAVQVGRDELAALGITDGRVSRKHVSIQRNEAMWAINDQNSRNGTFVNGQLLRTSQRSSSPIVRIGHTILLPLHDTRPYLTQGLPMRDGTVMGPTLHAVHERITMVGRSGSNLLILGNSGVGKELAARTFHAASGAGNRPFVAINCATIQHEIAERILFGARRGAYTGASTDAVGLVQAADGGTLFLDEIAELSPAVQAKLLRVLETRSVTPLGATAPVRVDIRLCAATHKDLRAEVQAGRFREDLYFRIGRPDLRIPPLASRREEIPWVIQYAVDSFTGDIANVRAGAEFVEACLLRPWPGNLRELLSETRTAALVAATRKRTVIAANDLDERAGLSLAHSNGVEESLDESMDEPSSSSVVDPESLEAALRAEQGNVVRAAARLGVSRGKVRRLIDRLGIDIKAFREG